MKGQRRRKVEWRRGEIDPSHAFLSHDDRVSVCGLRSPITYTYDRSHKCPNCHLALARLW